MNILVIHGPNLNKLQHRDSKHYGNLSLESIYQHLTNTYNDAQFTFYQSNHEGDLIDVILATLDEPYDAILINPGAYTHTSIALRDALEMVQCIKVEVHLSDINQREAFRKIDYIKDVCHAQFMGRQLESYVDAMTYIVSNNKK